MLLLAPSVGCDWPGSLSPALRLGVRNCWWLLHPYWAHTIIIVLGLAEAKVAHDATATLLENLTLYTVQAIVIYTQICYKPTRNYAIKVQHLL